MPSHTMPLYHETKVVLTDIDIPFNRLVWIMAKWILASIPAITLATVIFYGLLLLFFLMFGAPFWME